MKKTTIYFLMALFGLAFSSGVSAQTYFTGYGNIARTDRGLTTLTFKRNDFQIASLPINQVNASPVYFDKTTQIIEVSPGSSLTVNYTYRGTWMRNIIYVDWNKDISFTTTDASERIGYNTAAGGDEMTKPITYTIPAGQAVGDYRMRIMVDWVDASTNHSSPNAQKASIADNGGSVVDVILRVMPFKVSNVTNTYWYYMKNQGDYNSDFASNRAGKVLTKNAQGYYYGVEPWNNKTTWAKFKIVAGTNTAKYDIVTEDGLYLSKGVNGDLTTNNAFKAVDNSDWIFT